MPNIINRMIYYDSRVHNGKFQRRSGVCHVVNAQLKRRVCVVRREKLGPRPTYVSALLSESQYTCLPERRYAKAGTSYGPVSVCLSQVGVLLKWLDGSSSFLAWRLLSTSPALCFNEIQVCTKIRVLPSGTFLWTLDLDISPRPVIDRQTCYQLSSRKVDVDSVINWTVVCQLSW